MLQDYLSEYRSAALRGDKKAMERIERELAKLGMDRYTISQLVPVPKSRKPSPYERTRAQVYATGNKWAIENFNATH